MARETEDDMAEQVNTAIKDPRRAGPFVVALGFGASGGALIRAASALARDSGAELECVTIDTGTRISPEEGERVAEAQRLARGLGGRIAGEAKLDAVAGVLEYARRRGARAIVAGAGKRRPFSRGFADRIGAEGREFELVTIASPRASGREARAGELRSLGPWTRYLAAFLIIAAVTGLNFLLAGYAGYWAAAIPYLAAISLSALVLESGPVLFAALLSALAWDLLFIPPIFTLHVTKPEDVFMLGFYFLVAVASGLMTSRLRASRELLAAREVRMSAISSLASALAGAKTIEKILDTGIEAVKEALSVEAIVILKEGEGLKQQAESGWEPLDESAREAARVAYKTKWSAGRFTDIRPDSEWHFVPMEGPTGCLGVIGVRAASDRAWDEGLEAYLRTMVATISIAAARELAE
jgi:two-component system, OmpR family, sensor histidine kinase KdpD